MARGTITTPDERGTQLAEELDTTLNREFPGAAEYRAAVESALTYLEGVLEGLGDDDPDGDAEEAE